MIKNLEILLNFEKNLELITNNSYTKKLQIFESMLKFRNQAIKTIDLFEGLDEKIDFVKRLHSVK